MVLFVVVSLSGLSYKTIHIDGVLTGANQLTVGQGVDFVIGEKVRQICMPFMNTVQIYQVFKKNAAKFYHFMFFKMQFSIKSIRY